MINETSAEIEYPSWESYEALLRHGPDDVEKAESFWDSRARQFNKHQIEGKSRLHEHTVTSLVHRELITPGSSILEIGAGSGRYTLPLAKVSGHVTATDISAQMLEHLKENAAAAGLSNIDTRKLDWNTIELGTLGFEKQFDLVFAAMCPAVRSKNGLEKMSRASSRSCVVAQFIESRAPVRQKSTSPEAASGRHDPHNDRDALYAMFNLLWLQGYTPEIRYKKETETNGASTTLALISWEVQ
ncbi:class I SAM-dependent methyltransferase [Sediminispirochaeta bajacaliforniensis]|uniref:class I SAM-dependent methyltransferase n=1 Tax=Sediminispirochaeta bajacaliforniensis TaxID=148 RepID=UPI000360FC4F|nr:class I SAM-dependent methyltransferase [Sediminispirochaeta bajacaliforniensis]